TGPLVTALTPLDAGASVLRIEFSEAIRADSFTTADVRVTRPDASTVAEADLSVEAVDARTFLIHMPGNRAEGRYQVRIGPDVLDRAGNPMQQPGSATPAPYRGSFTIDRTPPAFVSAAPQGTAAFLPDHFEVTFTEAVDLASLRAAATVAGPTGSVAVTG